MKALWAILIGMGFSIPYGFANWVGWQSLKQGSLIPCGSVTGKYGAAFGVLLKISCIILMLFSFLVVGWWFLLSFCVMWFVGGRFATWIERCLYCSGDLLDRLEYHAKKSVQRFGEEIASQSWSQMLPRWWINRMSRKWEKRYVARIGRILYSLDPTDPLFSHEKFQDRTR